MTVCAQTRTAASSDNLVKELNRQQWVGNASRRLALTTSERSLITSLVIGTSNIYVTSKLPQLQERRLTKHVGGVNFLAIKPGLPTRSPFSP